MAACCQRIEVITRHVRVLLNSCYFASSLFVKGTPKRLQRRVRDHACVLSEADAHHFHHLLTRGSSALTPDKRSDAGGAFAHNARTSSNVT